MPAEALRAVRFATQQREIAAVHHQPGADDDAVDALAEGRVLPFDRGNVERVRIEQDCGNFSARRAVRDAVECAKLEHHLNALAVCQLQASHERAGTFSGEAALQTFDGVLARSRIVIVWDDETAASRDATDEPKLMVAVGIAEQDMTAVVGVHARQDWREIVKMDGTGGCERLRRGSNDNSGR